jgi:Dirigent-like protein
LVFIQEALYKYPCNALITFIHLKNRVILRRKKITSRRLNPKTMAALTLSVFFLLASTALAIDETQNTGAVKEERPAFQALPRQLLGGWIEFSFHLYLNEIFSGPDNTTETVVSWNSEYPNFGDIMIMDEPLWDDLKKTKLVARAQGAAFQANKNVFSWLLAYNIVFELEG